MRELTTSLVPKGGKSSGLVTNVGLTYEHTMGHVLNTLPVSNKGLLIRNGEHNDPRGRVMPLPSIIGMLKGEGEASMENLCGLQAWGKVTAGNDVQLGW